MMGNKMCLVVKIEMQRIWESRGEMSLNGAKPRDSVTACDSCETAV